MNSCKDKAGAATGIPDIAVLQTEVGAAVLADLVRGAADRLGVPVQRHRSAHVPRSATRSTTTTSTSTAPTRCTVCSSIPKDLPSTIASTMPIFRAENQMGIKSDAEFGVSGTAIQTDYTPVAQAIKSHNSTYAPQRRSTTRAPC